MNNNDDSRFSSYVFMDIETTGLPGFEKTKTRMTEICLISFSKHQIKFGLESNNIPRAVQKLVLIMNPQKSISERASIMSGLTDSNLSEESPFDVKKATTIKLFLDQLPQPICFIAHNGYNFDFPLLKEEFKDYGEIIPEGTVFSDSIVAFRCFGKKTSDEAEFMTFNPYTTKLDIDLCTAAEVIERELDNSDMKERQRINETTPNVKVKGFNVRKKLFSDGDNYPKTKSYTLNYTYEYLFGEPMHGHHTAEGDVLALIKCCFKAGMPIFKWFEQNNKHFSEIKLIY